MATASSLFTHHANKAAARCRSSPVALMPQLSDSGSRVPTSTGTSGSSRSVRHWSGMVSFSTRPNSISTGHTQVGQSRCRSPANSATASIRQSPSAGLSCSPAVSRMSCHSCMCAPRLVAGHPAASPMWLATLPERAGWPGRMPSLNACHMPAVGRGERQPIGVAVS